MLVHDVLSWFHRSSWFGIIMGAVLSALFAVAAAGIVLVFYIVLTRTPEEWAEIRRQEFAAAVEQCLPSGEQRGTGEFARVLPCTGHVFEETLRRFLGANTGYEVVALASKTCEGEGKGVHTCGYAVIIRPKR